MEGLFSMRGRNTSSLRAARRKCPWGAKKKYSRRKDTQRHRKPLGAQQKISVNRTRTFRKEREMWLKHAVHFI